MNKLSKRLLLSFSVLLLSFPAYSQPDSVKTLFHSFPENIRWQWDEAFGVFSFKSAVLMGSSTDLVGVVYKNNLHIAIGVEEAGDNEYFNPYFLDPKTYTGNNWHAGYYIVGEPIFWHRHLFQLSVPVKLMYVQNMNGNKNGFTDGFTADPGISATVNLFQFLACGINANYRIGFNQFINESDNVLTNRSYTLQLLLRLTI